MRNTRIRGPARTSVALLVSAFCAVAQTGTITTVAGSGVEGFSGDGGLATSAALDTPTGLAVDAAGNLYVADGIVHRVRKIAPDGIITTVAGDGVGRFSGDLGLATSASLNNPLGVAVSRGTLYIADWLNNRVRALNLSTGRIFTVVPLTLTLSPVGVAVDSADNLYITCTFPQGHVIKATRGSFSIVNTGQLFNPFGIAVDVTGNLYIADNSRNRVRKVTPTGEVTTIADGISEPVGVAVDAAGNLYIADAAEHEVLKVASAGGITVVAGTGSPGFSGDGGPATSASLNFPHSLAVDVAGNLYISDAFNHRVRMVTGLSAPVLRIPGNGVVNAAIFLVGPLAPDSWVSLFGENLAAALVSATTVPLPTMLGGTQVTVTDSLGVERLARLQFVAPGQLNFLMSPDTAPGPATVTVTTAEGQSASVVVQVAPVAPGLFTANASGMGPAAATFLIVEADESRTEGLTFDSTSPLGGRTNIPIDLGPAGRQVYVSFFGTGFRLQSSAAVQIGGVDVPILGAVAQGQFDGLDQAVVGPLPPTLGGRGDVEAIFTFDGIQANAVTVKIQ